MRKRLLPLIFYICWLAVQFFTGCGSNDSGKQAANTSKENNMKTENGNTQPDQKSQAENLVIVINDITLTESMLSDFQKSYNTKPGPGKYWYDSTSGLWGTIGGQALGFIFPGHAFGTMKSNVSNGNSGIFINGRHISVAEASIWGQLLGSPAQPGSYWLDGLGNVGYEGMPYAAFNLYVVAAQNNYRRGGSGGGGDNFWSGRFSAGNSSADGGTGYVSIPGQGVIASYGD